MHTDAANDPSDDGSRWEYTLHIPHDARAIGIARSTLHVVLVRHGLAELIDTAVLLASELLTNAYLHSRGPASLRLRWKQGVLRLGVWDTDPTPPHPAGPADRAHQPATAETGRGLHLVRACADDWGWFLLGDDIFGARGKYVWCELGAKPSRPEWSVAA